MASELILGFVKSKFTGDIFPYYEQDDNGYRVSIKGIMIWSNRSNWDEVDGPEEESLEDNINKPNHYHKGGIDVLTFVQGKLSKEAIEGFYQINVLKYVTRYKEKNGIEDLKKARYYLDKLIEG